MSIEDYGDLTPAEIVDELEAIRDDLTADNARLAEQVKAIEPMRMEYERGGYDAVIVGLQTRLTASEKTFFLESEKAASWRRSAEYWQREAIKLGWSRDLIIDIEPAKQIKACGEVSNG